MAVFLLFDLCVFLGASWRQRPPSFFFLVFFVFFFVCVVDHSSLASVLLLGAWVGVSSVCIMAVFYCLVFVFS